MYGEKSGNRSTSLFGGKKERRLKVKSKACLTLTYTHHPTQIRPPWTTIVAWHNSPSSSSNTLHRYTRCYCLFPTRNRPLPARPEGILPTLRCGSGRRHVLGVAPLGPLCPGIVMTLCHRCHDTDFFHISTNLCICFLYSPHTPTVCT